MNNLLKGVFCALVVLILFMMFVMLNWKARGKLLESTGTAVQSPPPTAMQSPPPTAMQSPPPTAVQSPTLTAVQLKNIKKFVFFVGYARSGHSIIGALMDAHPHVIISNQFYLFSHFQMLDRVPDQNWKNNLFGLLYNKSVEDAGSVRASPEKGYTLAVEGQWQGSFDGYIEVIGDKCGGKTTTSFLKDKVAFKRNYEKLKRELSVPIRIIHAVRNPFDIISTKLNYRVTNISQYRNTKLALQSSSSTAVKKLQIPDKKINSCINGFFSLADGVVEMIEEVFGRENVLEVHNCDLVDDPRGTISRIFQFLEVYTSEEYLDACAAKVFKSVSRSRDTIEWSPELRKMVKEKIKEYRAFSRYNFTSD